MPLAKSVKILISGKSVEADLTGPDDELFWPISKTIETWLAEWQKIDLSALDAEKRRMLDQLREAQSLANS